MDKWMRLTDELDMENSSKNQDSHGEQFICRVANSGLVLKFEVDKYWTSLSESTIPLHEVRSAEKENARDPLDYLELNCAQNVIPLAKQSQNTNVDLVEMPMAHAWHQKHGTGTTDLPVSVACSSDAHSSGEKDKMREAAELFTTLVKRVRKETVKEPSPPSVKTPVCTICSKTFSSYQALGRHKFVHNKQKNSLLGDGAGSSSGTGERCALKYVCRKCSEKFLTRKSLGRHIHKHWREIFKMKQPSARRKNLKPPVPLARGTMQSSGPMVLPTDERTQPPVLPTTGNVCSTRTELVVANAAVHQPPTPDFEGVQQQQLANRMGNEIESPCSTFPKILNDTGAALPAPKQISPAVKYAFDLNMFPHETDGWEP